MIACATAGFFRKISIIIGCGTVKSSVCSLKTSADSVNLVDKILVKGKKNPALKPETFN